MDFPRLIFQSTDILCLRYFFIIKHTACLLVCITIKSRRTQKIKSGGTLSNAGNVLRHDAFSTTRLIMFLISQIDSPLNVTFVLRFLWRVPVEIFCAHNRLTNISIMPTSVPAWRESKSREIDFAAL